MRLLVVPLALLAGLVPVAPASAAGAGQPTSSLAASSLRVMFGNSVSLTGRVSSRRAGVRVAIEIRPIGGAPSTALATTRSGGVWTARQQPARATSYRARVGDRSSRPVVVGVQPLLSLAELPDGRLSVRAEAGRTLRGAVIAVQSRRPSAVWTSVAKATLGAGSRAVLATRLPSGLVRITLSVNQAGPGYLGSTSHPIEYRAYRLTLDPETFKVLYGHVVTLRGRLQNGHAGQRIRITAARYGGSARATVAIVRTRRNGAWSAGVRPGIATTYQAFWAGTQRSPARTVGVRPLVSIAPARNGAVEVTVVAGRSLRGRAVQLQAWGGGGWVTIGKALLGPGSRVVFTGLRTTSTVRAALSVNQAGVGYLGAESHPLTVRPLT